jgi:hypothetical protein
MGEETKEGEKLDYLAKREEYLDNPDNAEELKALDDEWNEKEWPTFEEDPYIFTNHYYAVCGDTLGQDRTLSTCERKELEKFVKYFGKCWTER